MAEVNRVKVPIQSTSTVLSDRCGIVHRLIRRLWCGIHPGELEVDACVHLSPVFAPQPPYNTPHPSPLTINAEYERIKQRQYLVHDTNVFFTQTQRITLVADTVERTMIKGSEILDRGGTLLKDHHENEVGSM
jgi:hypothetical protein